MPWGRARCLEGAPQAESLVFGKGQRRLRRGRTVSPANGAEQLDVHMQKWGLGARLRCFAKITQRGRRLNCEVQNRKTLGDSMGDPADPGMAVPSDTTARCHQERKNPSAGCHQIKGFHSVRDPAERTSRWENTPVNTCPW